MTQENITTESTDIEIHNSKLEATVTQYFADIEGLKEESKNKTAVLYAQIKEIESSIRPKIYAVETMIKAMQEKYSDLAFDLAIEQGECPRSRWGSHLTPNEIDLKEDGIHLTWIQENPYGRDNYDHFHATWSDLLNCETNQKN